MKKVIIGDLSNSANEVEIDNNESKSILVSKIRFLREEMTKAEEELAFHTKRFLETKNEYGVNVISGISSCIYLPSFFGKDDYMIDIIDGVRNRNLSDEVDENTIFDVASITKMFTLITLLKLVDLGYVSLDEKICDINPDFQHLEDFTLNDLMRLHGKYSTRGDITKAVSKEEAEEILKTLYLTDNTREENTYNDFGAIVIADTLAKRMSEVKHKNITFEDVLKEYVLEPLGMFNTVFNPKTNNVSGNGNESSLVHDPKARILGGVCGHAGLFTNANDLSLLADDIFKANSNKGKVVSKKMLDKLSEITFNYTKQYPKGNLGMYRLCPKGLDVSFLPNTRFVGSFASQGWTGSVAIFDPVNKIHQSILVNTIYSSDSKDEVRNDKPVFFNKAFREYQERVDELSFKMRCLKNYYDSYKSALDLESSVKKIKL